MAYLSLYRRWRPQSFSEMVGQEHVMRTLMNAINMNRISHAYLFCGPRGTGKTSTAKLLAKALNCVKGMTVDPCNECESCQAITEGRSMDVIEIDAASNRGIDEIRDLREKVKYAPTGGRYKVYIIDEVHMLTTEAFNALLKTLEEPPSHAVFILATTEVRRIPATVLSRCQRFDFRRLTTREIAERLQQIADSGEVKAEADAIRLIARYGEGSMRDAQSILDQCEAFGGDSITVRDVLDLLGAVDSDLISDFIMSLAEGDVSRGLHVIKNVSDSGRDIRQFITDILLSLRDIMIVKECEEPGDLLPVAGPEAIAELRRKSKLFSSVMLVSIVEHLTELYDRLKWSARPEILMEVTLVKLIGMERGIADYADFDKPVRGGKAVKERAGKIGKGIKSGRFVGDGGEGDRIDMGGSDDAAAIGGSDDSTATGGDNDKSDGEGEDDVAHGSEPRESSESGESSEDGEQIESSEIGGSGESSQSTLSSNPERDHRLWNLLLDRLKEEKRTLHALLFEGKLIGVEGNTISVGFKKPYSFHKDSVMKQDNRRVIEKIAEQLFKRSMKLKALFLDEEELAKDTSAGTAEADGKSESLKNPGKKLVKNSEKRIKKSAHEDREKVSERDVPDIVNDVLKVFGGKIIEP